MPAALAAFGVGATVEQSRKPIRARLLVARDFERWDGEDQPSSRDGEPCPRGVDRWVPGLLCEVAWSSG